MSDGERTRLLRQSRRRRLSKNSKVQHGFLSQSLFGWPLGKLMLVAPAVYAVLSFVFSYGVAFGISWEMPKLFTVGDFFRVALPYAAFLLPLFAMLAIAFSMNFAIAILGKEKERHFYLGLMQRGRVSMFALPFLLFSACAILNALYLSESIEFFGVDNPLGIINVSIGAFMILGPLMLVPPITMMDRISTSGWAFLASAILMLVFFAGNFVGIVKAKGYDSSATIDLEGVLKPKLVIVIDEYVVVREGNSIIARPKTDQIVLTSN